MWDEYEKKTIFNAIDAARVALNTELGPHRRPLSAPAAPCFSILKIYYLSVTYAQYRALSGKNRLNTKIQQCRITLSDTENR